MSAPVLVCFAVKEEAAPFRRVLPPNVTIVVSGMGPAAAERAAKEQLSAGRWSLVLTCGFTGGLNPALAHDTVLFEAGDEFPLREKFLAAGAIAGRFHCADRVAVTALEKAALRERTGADAVEMESGVIRRWCRERGIPSATVRVVSDTAGEDLPLDFNALMKADGKLDFRKLVGQVLLHPSKIPALLTLGRRSNSAARRLTEVLRATLR